MAWRRRSTRRPPPRNKPRPDPRCPHCTARDAEVISLFGTQAMTLQYRCRKCGTVFEAIKYG
ncbi:MAG: hypothetical protein E6H95_08045 [Chloroflexi bacterium]|nr:MAG: hypothetical protein E6I82_05490 [Chloroflexota bacterium]TMG27584.1 MAG: hypothetical protein E6H95_08045 [Chloroflexota bacterium]